MININRRKPPEFTPTGEQSAVLECNSSNMLINATAGAGKSLLLRKLAWDNQDKKILYLAYNKAIVEDIRHKLPPNCDVQTIHAFGLSTIRKNMSCKVDFYKYNKLTRKKDIPGLISIWMSVMPGNTTSAWVKLCQDYGYSTKLAPEAREVIRRGKINIISGNDMIALPVQMDFPMPEYDMVLIDEMQDLSRDKLLLLSRINSERFVFVGDNQQAINQFSGSSPTIEQDILSSFKPERLEINETFRCPEAVINSAREIYPTITGSKPGGKVEKYTHGSNYPDDSLIICRANAPLLKVATHLIRQNRRFRIKPKAIDNLEYALNGFSKYKKYTKHETIANVNNAIHSCRMSKFNPEYKLMQYDAVLELLNSGSHITDAYNTINLLKARSKMSSGIMLSTCHSSKGLESNNVYILKESICDKVSKSAKTEWARESERNCKFVMRSRSLNNLSFIEG